METRSVASPFSSATELARRIAQGQETSEALTEEYLERIRVFNPGLAAIVQENAEGARSTARERDGELDGGGARGPLHGVPVTVKEAFDMKGFRTTVNFNLLKDNVAERDAMVVRRLGEAGAVILGKTNIPTMLADYQSFGPLYPTAANPFDASRTPGGSTGGGGAALAAGLTALEIGSDIGGSIRVPSHFCGVFGLKPTENAIAHGQGHVPPPPDARGGYVSMESVGPLARAMSDIELAWSVINQPSWDYFGHFPQKPPTTKPLSEYRIGWFGEAWEIACGEETRRVLGDFVQKLEAAGVGCRERPLDKDWSNEAYEVWALLFGAIAGQDVPWIGRALMKRQFSRMGRGTTLDILQPLKKGLSLDFKAFARGLRRRMELIQRLHRYFDDVDFIVSPTAAGPAFAHNPKHEPIELEGRTLPYMDYVAPFTVPYNACGNPVLVVPAGQTSEGLPIGLQIAAPHYHELDLIRFGTLVEELGAARFRAPDGY